MGIKTNIMNIISKSKEKIEKLPYWFRALLFILTAAIIIYETQTIFIDPSGSLHEFWKLFDLRKGVFSTTSFFGSSSWEWFWIDTFLYFVGSFISGFIGAFFVYLGLKKQRLALSSSTLLSLLVVYPFSFHMFKISHSPILPMCLREEIIIINSNRIALWGIISLMLGNVVFFSVLEFYRWTKEKENENETVKKRMKILRRVSVLLVILVIFIFIFKAFYW